MARALYMDGKRLAAREALEEVLSANPKGELRREALLLSARMRIDDQSGSEGLALYEQLLAEGAFPSPEGRNEVHWRAAVLAFELEEWEKARSHALAAGAGTVPVRVQFRNQRHAILALYMLGKHKEGIAEVRALQNRREYRTYRGELKLLEARGTEGLGKWPEARRLYGETVRLGPRTAAGAEAWYRMGEHLFDRANREDSARAYFDSAAAAGRGFEYGGKAVEVAAALKRLAELRVIDSAYKAPPDTVAADSSALADAGEPGESGDKGKGKAVRGKTPAVKKAPVPKPESHHSTPFLIAELFHFRLPKPDSARVYLNRIVADTVEDTIYSRRAYYALAYIEENSFHDKARADSLYRAIMARYPATEWAKQAEKNLGLPATVETPDDKAHALFLQAERLRIAGENIPGRVVPAHRAVSENYPSSPDAAKALFVIAFLTEQSAVAKRDSSLVDTVKAAYAVVRDKFPGTPYAAAAEARIAGIESYGDGSEQGGGSGRSGSSDWEGDGEDTEDESDVPRRELLDAASEQDLY
jgi:TolA-binding protein